MFNFDEAIPGAPNFTFREFFRSNTAESRGIDNYTDNPEILANIQRVASMCLQPARTAFGASMKVSSGYRSPALNQAVGGSPASFHSYGMAADNEIAGVPNLTLFQWYYRQGVATELIAEECSPSDPTAGWIHVAIAPGREGEMATKYKLPGTPVRRASFEEILSIFGVSPI